MIPSRANPLILVVEDDEDLLEALCESLRVEGIECAEARNGSRALELLRAGCRPDLVLLDLRMPGMDGLEFLRAWRREGPETKTAPVVVLSGDDGLLPEAARLGTVASVRKPVRIDALLDALRPYVRVSPSPP
jgi:CheY-like chemotaxis protein